MMRGIHRRIEIEVTDELCSRFWAGVDRRGPDDCWPWKRSFRNGYGAIKHKGKTLSAHRVALAISGMGGIIGGLVLHRCDNKACCNPSHLSEGTPSRNVHEMVARGRQKNPSGCLHRRASLSEDQVRRVRRLRSEGLRIVDIAREVGCTVTVADKIIRGVSYRGFGL